MFEVNPQCTDSTFGTTPPAAAAGRTFSAIEVLRARARRQAELDEDRESGEEGDDGEGYQGVTTTRSSARCAVPRRGPASGSRCTRTTRTRSCPPTRNGRR